MFYAQVLPDYLYLADPLFFWLPAIYQIRIKTYIVEFLLVIMWIKDREKSMGTIFHLNRFTVSKLLNSISVIRYKRLSSLKPLLFEQNAFPVSRFIKSGSFRYNSRFVSPARNLDQLFFTNFFTVAGKYYLAFNLAIQFDMTFESRIKGEC